jgi:hypothetical protein
MQPTGFHVIIFENSVNEMWKEETRNPIILRDHVKSDNQAGPIIEVLRVAEGSSHVGSVFDLL